MTVSNTLVSLYPVWVAAKPYIIQAVAYGVGGYLLNLARTKLHLDISAKAKADLEAAAANAAGRILASQDRTFLNAKVDVHSQVIKDAVPVVVDEAAKAVKALGYTPDKVASIVTAKLGALQAVAHP